MTSTDARVLFIHGGPGFSAELERRRYGSALPIHWWDQPRGAADDAHAFETLINAAESEVRRMSRLAGGPISLLAAPSVHALRSNCSTGSRISSARSR